MPVREGKAVLRASLDEDLLIQLKIAAVRALVQPNNIVDAALRLFLSDKANLETLKRG